MLVAHLKKKGVQTLIYFYPFIKLICWYLSLFHFVNFFIVCLQYVKTLESQSHLITVPLDVCPTYWPLASNSLSLYPMPDLVCVADANAPEYSTNDSRNSDSSSTKIMSSSGCVFINPVSVFTVLTTTQIS